LPDASVGARPENADKNFGFRISDFEFSPARAGVFHIEVGLHADPWQGQVASLIPREKGRWGGKFEIRNSKSEIDLIGLIADPSGTGAEGPS
jgi:hypothetical protein